MICGVLFLELRTSCPNQLNKEADGSKDNNAFNLANNSDNGDDDGQGIAPEWRAGHLREAGASRSCVSDFLYDDPAVGIDEDVIAVTVLARRDVVTVAVALRVDDFVARHALQRYGGAQVFADVGVCGTHDRGVPENDSAGERKSGGFTTGHGVS
jgi:hypothetical protein